MAAQELVRVVTVQHLGRHALLGCVAALPADLGADPQRRQQLDESMERLQTHICHMISLRTERLRGVTLQLHSLSPLLTIARGYAIVRRDDNQKIVSQVEDAQSGDYLTIQVQDGNIPVEVRRRRDGSLTF